MNANDITDKAQEWEEQAKDLRAQAKDFQERARQAAVNAGRATDQYVRENPWRTVLFAVLAGCALGLVLSRSRD
jgi:ElaB/YqjD/DUF883 family membrane-anchored ribosome-binding protein